jgi:hypothetical protein
MHHYTFDQNFIDRNLETLLIYACVDWFIHWFIDFSINIIGMTTFGILFYLKESYTILSKNTLKYF